MLTLFTPVFVVAAGGFAATECMKTQHDSEVRIAPGIKLVVHPGALDKQTRITADLVRRQDSVCFDFGPDGTKFAIPAELRVSWRAIKGLNTLALYGESGSRIRPRLGLRGLRYNIDHFSIYYFRKR